MCYILDFKFLACLMYSLPIDLRLILGNYFYTIFPSTSYFIIPRLLYLAESYVTILFNNCFLFYMSMVGLTFALTCYLNSLILFSFYWAYLWESFGIYTSLKGLMTFIALKSSDFLCWNLESLSDYSSLNFYIYLYPWSSISL